jgi:hypothetical protein
MKKLYHIFTMTGVFLFLLSGCHEAALVKSEVEDGFNWNSSNAPTITIGQPSGLTAKSVTLSASLSGVSDPSSIIDLGFMYSTESQFASSTIRTFACEYSETISATIPLNPNSTYYIKAIAATKDGYAASETVTVITPDVPLVEKLDGSIYGKKNVYDYWEDDAWDIEITIKEVGENTFHLCNFDPYFYDNGFTYDKGVNFAIGIFDPETNTMTVEPYTIGYQDAYIAGYDGSICDIIITFDEEGLTMTFQTLWGVHSPGGWYNLFQPLTLNRL